MTHLEIREKFLKFFEDRGHKIVPSSSLLPTDPSVLFTTAGMQQFKPYYTGKLDPKKTIHPGLSEPIGKNAVSIQKCIRTSDIDEVGDESHLTFFEMLGNFSFGEYWKKEAIEYAHKFITKEMGLKIDYVTIFGGEGSVPADEESEKIWKSIGPKIEIRKFGRKDNFWGPTGDEGPCGPTSEIYVGRIEIWNLVFNEYHQNKSGQLTPLKTKGIDTGMGLERLAMVAQNKDNIFETELFEPFMGKAKELIPNPLDGDRSYRIISDHLRASFFLIADGIKPSNKGTGAILRRLIRRTVLHSFVKDLTGATNITEFEALLKKGIQQNSDFFRFLREFFDIFLLVYKKEDVLIYPEFNRGFIEIETILYEEAFLFLHKLKEGMEHYYGLDKKISGKEAFLLHQSFGFSVEILRELNKKFGKEINELELDEEFKKHQEISRAGAEKKFGGHGLILDTGELKAGNEEELAKVTRLHTATHLLHAALRKILGDEVHQAGSDITAERLRFDFTFPRKMTAEEIKKVEDLVNETAAQNLPVTMKEMPYEEAIKKGAMAFFKLKYPPIVKVFTIGGAEKYNSPSTGSGQFFSKELCGGPHVTNTGAIGKFKITKEESVSAGTRRIRASVYWW